MTTVTITGAGTTQTATYTLSSSTVAAVNAGTVGTASANPGVYITGSNDTLTNSGVILGGQVNSGSNGALVVNGTGDNVTNQSGGVIQGYGYNVTGIYFVSVGTITNSGTIGSGEGPVANSADGIVLHVGGVVTNAATGTISGGGIFSQGDATITNSGVILGDAIYGGVYLAAGGTVTNLTGGTISYGGAGYGVKIAGAAGTITNAGTITSGSGSGAAVVLSSGYTNRVIVDPGAVFIGTVNGGDAAQATLELASGASAGTITNVASFSNFGTLLFNTSSDWLVAGSSTTGLLSTATIAGFAAGDTLELAGTVTVTGSSTSGGVTQATLSSGGTLTFAGTISGFQVNTSGGVTDLTEQPTCFCRGTRILTDRGERAVEDLRIGDRVRTLTGRTEEPIVWIGYRHLDCQHHPEPQQIWPIRIAADAFGPGVPHGDLLLSPDHAVYVDDVLIPVKYLINNSTISQVPADDVLYYHIELATHEVLLAEGLPAESYLDTGDRAKFANGGEPVRLFPDFSVRTWDASGCAPLIVTGPQLNAVRRRVNERAATVEWRAAAAA